MSAILSIDLCKGASGKRVPGYEVELRDMDGKPVGAGRSRNHVGSWGFAGAVLLEPA